MAKPRRRAAPARQADSFTECRQRAVKLLTLRARSRQELARALTLRGFEPATVEQTLASLERSGLLDEKAALDGLLSSRRRRYGRERLARELEHRGFSETDVRRALTTVSPEEDRRLLETLCRRREIELADIPPDRRRKRVFDFLRRRGFESSQIFEVLGGSRGRDEDSA